MIQLDSSIAVVEAQALAVRTVDLSKSFDGRSVLRQINLKIGVGEYVALLGANGTGKSTLLRILATLLPPTSGQLLLFEQTLRPAGADLRARIGFIGHQPMLYRDLSASENLVFYARLYSVTEPGRRARQMLEMAGLESRADHPVKFLSRGMVQRLSIARALLHNPDIILADEPFSGLDAPSVQGLEQLLADLNAARKTIVLVNHDIGQSLRLAERAVVLRGGQIVVDEPTHRLYSREILSEVSAT